MTAKRAGSKKPKSAVKRTTPAVPVVSESRSFAIVGIGASAGGLEAMAQLFSHLPSDTGMAFLVIQHLDPTHPSLLTAALGKSTKMSVVEATDGTKVEPDHVYVIPPNSNLGIFHGDLTLETRPSGRKPHLAIDFCFRALAADQGSRAIGVILSGTASDGTEGLKAIKAEGGITFAQDPKSAKFSGMPDSAISAGVVDYRLTPDRIAEEITRLSRHPYYAAGGSEATSELGESGRLQKLFMLLRNVGGANFSEYKPSTVERRLARRMALLKMSNLDDYLTALQGDPKEARALAEDILIHVTSFFRDPEAFEALKSRVFPDLMKHKQDGASIRIWVAGCSTGEEAYSIAIALLEFLGEAASKFHIQIFATDISEDTIRKARKGIFAESVVSGIGQERLRRFFHTVDGGGYQISKVVRELCVFVRHDITRDPPFSKLDLVTCRNVLIYFGQVLQNRVMPLFHYCLNVPGFLLLGRTEASSHFGQFFAAVDKENKIYSRTPMPSRMIVPSLAPEGGPWHRALGSVPVEPLRGGIDLKQQSDQILLSRYVPPSVLVNERLDILQVRGRTGPYLELAPGQPQTNLVKMAREGLLFELRQAVDRAKSSDATVRREGIRFEHDGHVRTVTVEVVPLPAAQKAKERLFLVLFQDSPAKGLVSAKRIGAKERRAEARAETLEDRKLKEELAITKEYLRSLSEDHQKTGNDFASVNEELQSSNEELQSTNEELETAKEELQSANEELTTVNDEMQNRNHELNQVNNDLVNLIASVDIPIVIIGGDRRIRRFTPRARSIMNVIPTDIGRPIDDIKTNLIAPNLDDWISEVLETIVIKEAEVQDRAGRWYRLQIRPYRTTDNRIDGVVLALVDVDAFKKTVATAENARDEAGRARVAAESANLAKDTFLATLSHELRTPLSSMLMRAHQLAKGGLDDAATKKAGEAIERGVRVQTQLIEDLLDVSRIVSGKLNLEKKNVGLGPIVRAVIDVVQPLAATKSIDLEIALDPSAGAVSVDPVRMQQVFWNLLTNAVKFTPSGGRISVVLDKISSDVRVVVTDTGSGIKPEFLPHLFERFSQADSTSTRTFSGLGLGLAIVKHLVELHEGSVQAQSPGKGKGSTFTVTLPLIDTTARLPGSPSRESPSNGNWSQPQDGEEESSSRIAGIRVLLVEDDQDAREAIADMLRDASAEVMTAGSAAEAMAMIARTKPDVLLCDIAMPGEDGYSLMTRLRALGPDEGGLVPAAALTAYASDEDRARALAAGFQMHVAKPVDAARLATVVSELAER